VRIGVLIPAYNAAPWIADAIGSVLAQTHRDWRMVVVDDGSTDATGAVVDRFRDPRIRLFRQANAGVSAARNAGIAALAEGPACDALLFLDADDRLVPDALTRLAAALDAAPAAAAASGPYAFAGTRRVRRPPAGDILARLLVRNLFANGGHVLVRWQALQRAGGFLRGIAFGEDWEFWIRIALQGPFASAGGRAPVLLVRQNADSAYGRLATQAAAFQPCMEAIFTNPLLRERFGAERLAAIRKRTEAENDWIIGRELIRHGEPRSGRRRLRRSFGAAPGARRAALLIAAHILALLPDRWQGPFRAYEQCHAVAGRDSFACRVPTSPCGRKMMNTTKGVP
jgi:glycosyltransferase involved in cell wall biosynthesis